MITASIPSSSKKPLAWATYKPVWFVLGVQSSTMSTFTLPSPGCGPGVSLPHDVSIKTDSIKIDIKNITLFFIINFLSILLVFPRHYSLF